MMSKWYTSPNPVAVCYNTVKFAKWEDEWTHPCIRKETLILVINYFVKSRLYVWNHQYSESLNFR